MNICFGEIAFDRAALDRLMPLRLHLDNFGRIISAGPTFQKITPGADITGFDFFELFELRRPMPVEDIATLRRHGLTPLKLRLFAAPETPLRGIAVPVGDTTLINLSFGYSVVDAVRQFGLTNEDFAPTELAIELLYLVEAKSAAFEESRRLNRRLHQAHDTAQEQANTDVLTGLKNRRALMAHVQSLIENKAEFALVHIDLDFFKEVNDTLGHAAGDAVLREASRLLRAQTRPGDMAARMGGDEFVVVLQRVRDEEEIAAFAARLIEEIERPIPYKDQECRISASIGATLSSSYDPPDRDRMFRDSDVALYTSKREGRARATVAEPGINAEG